MKTFLGLMLLAAMMLAFQNCEGFNQKGSSASGLGDLDDLDDAGDEVTDIDTGRPLLDQYETILLFGPSATAVGECSEVFTVQLENSFDEIITVNNPQSFATEDIPSGTMFADANCTVPVQAGGVTIPVDSDRFEFYLLSDEPLMQNILIFIPRLNSTPKFHNVFVP